MIRVTAVVILEAYLMKDLTKRETERRWLYIHLTTGPDNRTKG